jgi:hypothetical protein
MKPIYWIIAIVLGAGTVGAWQYSQQRQEARAAQAAAEAPAATEPPVGAAPAAAPMETPVEPGTASAADQVAQWITDVDSTDAARRAAAIRALAQAPRAQALPVLHRLVTHGDPADRPIALQSLRDLALAQGDADNGIRSAIREVIYHGDDEQLATGAQEALDAVETSEQKKS